MQVAFPFDSDLEKIFKLLNYNARLVGGCVRDFILFDKLVDDIDIATPLLPKEVISLLSREFSVIPTGLKHGTVTVVGLKKYEITTLRSDENTDGRHADVIFNSSYEEDAKRRDFTINALYLDYNGNVYDYFYGLEDLKNKKVKFIGNAADRINEDFLRILRFFRFSMRFGTMDLIDMQCCYDCRDGLLSLSKERVTQEWFNIIKGEYFFEYFVYFMPIMQVLNFYLPLDIDFYKINKLSALGLTAYFYSKNIFLCFSNVQKKYINDLLFMKMNSQVDAIMIYNKYGEIFFKDKLIIDNKNFEAVKVSNCPVNGLDLMNLGYIGKEIGELLKKIEYEWYSLKGQISKEKLLEKVHEQYF